MKISHGTRVENISDQNGYGYATVNMIESLTRLGYEVNQNDPTADVEIWFEQPQHWKFSPGTYKIGYHPWESTQLRKEWVPIMNACDEVWTPSPIIADWYRRFAGITRPIHVYEHGVNPVWAPKKREVDGTFKFLHVGADATRKGAKEAMQALRLAFPRHTDVEMNMKMISDGWNIGALRRINFINKKMSLEELIQLFYDNHAYVYPSYGEGFGLTPLQAMATGMPTITVPKWAPYADFLDSRLCVESSFVGSPWPGLHPGNMLKPKMDDLVESMRYCYENYDSVRDDALARVDSIMDYYDWDRLTKNTFKKLEERLQNSSKSLALGNPA